MSHERSVPDRRRVAWFALAGSVVVVALAATAARLVETDLGRLDVDVVRVPDPSGVTLTGKLYRPARIDQDARLPAVLALHGYQNDKETQGAFALELARRGVIVLALDLVGHGDSGGRLDLTDRGDGTGGGNAGYQFLKARPDVRANRIGIIGHSLGAISALQVARLNPDHRAVNSQCGPAGSSSLHNLLLTQARYEEFRLFREGEGRVESLDTHPRRLAAFGVTSRIEWDRTYGDFANGSARRVALVDTVHAGVTHHPKAVAETVSWMLAALEPTPPGGEALPADDQTYILKELAMLLALVAALLSMLPLARLLLTTALFRQVVRLSARPYVGTRAAWWGLVAINTLIAGLTYPPLTRLGGLEDQIGPRLPWLALPVGNGILIWFLCNAAIGLVLLALWLATIGRRNGVHASALGLETTVGSLCATGLLAAILVGWTYGLVMVSDRVLGIEFRCLWPALRAFSGDRFGLFWLYLPGAIAFFLVNGGMFLFGQARQPERATSARTQVAWWLWNSVAALSGLALVWAIQYVPLLAFGMAPGFEVLGLPQYGELWPLVLFGYIPAFVLLVFLLTWFFRQTGRVYLGAAVVAAIATWITAAGSVVAR